MLSIAIYLVRSSRCRSQLHPFLWQGSHCQQQFDTSSQATTPLSPYITLSHRLVLFARSTIGIGLSPYSTLSHRLVRSTPKGSSSLYVPLTLEALRVVFGSSRQVGSGRLPRHDASSLFSYPFSRRPAPALVRAHSFRDILLLTTHLRENLVVKNPLSCSRRTTSLFKQYTSASG